MKNMLETLFTRAWYYFDKIYVVGPSARHLLIFRREEPRARFDDVIRSYFELYSHIQEIGAEQYLTFREKYTPSQDGPGYFEAQFVSENEIRAVASMAAPWIESMAPDATITVESAGDDDWVRIELRHPRLRGSYKFNVQSERSLTEDALRLHALNELFESQSVAVLADLNFARMNEAPLGSVTEVHGDFLTQLPRPQPSELEVAFNIPMPFIEGLSTKEILRIRDHEAASFEVFRNALRQAITERLKASGNDSTSEDIALDIVEDLIIPALADIENKLDAALRLLKRGSSVGLAAGGTVATVGLLTGFPIAGPLVGAALALPDVRNYFNARREIESSDLYFLWNISEKSMHASVD